MSSEMSMSAGRNKQKHAAESVVRLRTEPGAKSQIRYSTDEEGPGMSSYTRFGVMVAISKFVMFGLMYVNTYEIDHVVFSEARAYMAVIMGAAMAVIVLAFMPTMYPNPRANAGILVGSTALFVLALWLVRSQATVDDVAWMEAMIPHHSVAILTSERARIADPRVRTLADGIIKTQRREIGEMKTLIRDLGTRR